MGYGIALGQNELFLAVGLAKKLFIKQTTYCNVHFFVAFNTIFNLKKLFLEQHFLWVFGNMYLECVSD
jgi:hypothetical protein